MSLLDKGLGDIRVKKGPSLTFLRDEENPVSRSCKTIYSEGNRYTFRGDNSVKINLFSFSERALFLKGSKFFSFSSRKHAYIVLTPLNPTFV